MASKWSTRAQAIESFKVMDLLKRADELEAQGKDLISLGAGEPDFGASPNVIRAAQKALETVPMRYTPSGGIQPLREAIVQFHYQRYGQTIEADQVLVTAGASAGLLLVFSALVEKDKQMLMADPGYPCNRQFLRVLESRARSIAVDAADKYQLNPKLIHQNWDDQVAGVLVASPANPTGSVLSTAELGAISRAVREHQGVLIVDEIYHGLVYDGETTSIAGVDSDAVAINSFSKYFGMTGWRLGWVVAQADAIQQMEKIAQNLFISPPTLSQYAALECFSKESIQIFEERRALMHQRRDRLKAGLEQLGFNIPRVPEGAFYIYADASALTDDSTVWCWSLLEQAGVVATPGADFGTHHPERYVRFAYTTSLEQIDRALIRIEAFINQASV